MLIYLNREYNIRVHKEINSEFGNLYLRGAAFSKSQSISKDEN